MENKKTASLMQNQYGEHVIKINFPYNLDTLNNIRSLAGRKWHKEKGYWTAPIFAKSLVKLQEWNFELCDNLLNYLADLQKYYDNIPKEKVGKLKGELYPFQKEGISWIESLQGRALIADEMGLGKTIQAIGWMSLHPKIRPVIIIVPASIKYNWASEISKWTHEKSVRVLSGTTAYPVKEEILIINYDILYAWLSYLRSCNPQIIIFDEVHHIKSNAARRTKAAKLLTKGVPHVIGLSGTPIVNRPIEAYNAISIIRPDLFPNRWKFAKTYCNLKHNGFGWDFSGHSNEELLHEKLTGSIMLRRLKKDVLKELPDKTFSHVPMVLSNEKEYKKAENDFVKYIMETKGREAAERASRAEKFTRVEALKQVCMKGKIKHVKEWIHDFLEIEDKLVVFAVHKFVIAEIMKEFGNIAVKIDGSTPSKERQIITEKFQTDKSIKLFVGNIKAAGEGITLTASSNVAFIELPWTPKDIDQASDRCHRIGQKDNVNVYYLISQNTIESKLATILDNKRKITTAIHDGKEVPQETLLSDLIKEYTQLKNHEHKSITE